MAQTINIYFLTVLDTRRSKIKVLASSGSHESSLPVWQMAINLLCPHMVLLGVYTERSPSFPLLTVPPILLKYGTTLVTPFYLNYVLKALSLNVGTLVAWASTYELERDGHNVVHSSTH